MIKIHSCTVCNNELTTKEVEECDFVCTNCQVASYRQQKQDDCICKKNTNTCKKNMKFYLSFGDYFHDGHGQYRNVLVSAPSMEQIKESQNKIKEKYGRYIFNGLCSEYDNPKISSDLVNILKDLGLDLINNPDFEDGQEELPDKSIIYVSIDICIKIYIWFLNQFGAEITIEEDYPIIICDGAGYGCFYS